LREKRPVPKRKFERIPHNPVYRNRVCRTNETENGKEKEKERQTTADNRILEKAQAKVRVQIQGKCAC
jgi:hypothetical protein